MTYRMNGEIVTREQFVAQSPERDWLNCNAPYVAMGMHSFSSPIDGKLLKNNKDLSAHNREYDVYQLGDDIIRKREEDFKELNQRKLDGEFND